MAPSHGCMSYRLALLAPALAMLACGASDAAPDAGLDVAIDGPPGPDAPWLDDGTPTREPCTRTFGSALSEVHGRLDGYLVAIVPSTESRCRGDNEHMHLQVRADGSVYDVAVNVTDPEDVRYLARDMSLPDGPWAEGWHVGQAALLDYRALGVHVADFTAMPQTQLEAAVSAELATANYVSIFMTGYGPDGGHLVHRNFGRDGAIVIRPRGAARLLMFHFANQTF